MSIEEMKQAHEEGILLNIGELQNLELYGSLYPNSEVCVRINPDIGGGEHKHVITGGVDSKFGIYCTQIDDVKRILKKYDLKLVGIH